MALDQPGRVAPPVDAEHRAIGPYIHDTGEEWPFAAFERPRKLRVLDLFSGIGGFSLGLERTGGFETVAFCEIEAFPRKVLARHWPNVPCYPDVRELTAERLAADGIGSIEVICGGFPCQDISSQGLRAGLAGERSGLWSEIARIAGELRPSFIIVENVADLLGLGFGEVLGDLAAIGFHAEWHCIPAGYVGAPHERDRLWIVAYAPEVEGVHESYFGEAAQRLSDYSAAWWKAGAWNAPDARICRVDDGLSDRVERTESLGNAVVPQIPELIGNAIIAARTPYRPADFNDWRDGIHKGLAASAGVLGSFHTPDNN